MTDTVHDRVTDVLEGADAELDGLSDDEAMAVLDGDDASSLGSVAHEAAALVREEETRELLDAVGLGELPDGSEADSIPEAIAKGDSEGVADLRALTKLAKLSDRIGAPEDEGADADRSAITDAVTDAKDAMTDRVDAVDEPTGGTDGPEDEREGREGDSGADVQDALRSAAEDAIGDFGDEVRGLKAEFESLREEPSVEDEGARADESESETVDESDDGDTTRTGDDGTGAIGSRGSGRLSTVAPSPSERPDVGRVGRLSTMPDRSSRSDN